MGQFDDEIANRGLGPEKTIELINHLFVGVFTDLGASLFNRLAVDHKWTSILAQRLHAGKRVFMRKLLGALIPLLALSGAILLAQEEFDFQGNTKDIRKLPPQTRQNHDYTFARLMYNGRIPGYLKNWYTDYPTGDRNLVDILRRITRM